MAENASQMARAQRFRPYPEYNDSGVEWLGEIPAIWHKKRLKDECHAAALYGANESASSYAIDGVRFLRTTDIHENGSLSEAGAVFLPKSSVRDYLLADGDILISRSGTLGRALHYSRARHGECAYAGYLVRFVPKKSLDPQFVFYYTKSQPFQDWLSISVIQSTIGNVNGQKYANLEIPIPSSPEQRAIASFLDRETAKIDALIAKKKRLIELLQEKRSALTTQAVIKGLDPNAPMKDSGVEWLGEVPEHWEMRRLSTVCGFEQGKAHEPFVDDDGEFVCVNSRFVSTEGKARKFCNRNLSPARKNDVLMVMSDLPNGRALAKAFFVTEDKRYAVNQRVCILSARHVNSRFLFYFLNRSPAFLRYDDGVNQTHLPNAAFTKCAVLLPPPPEQGRIVQIVDDVATRIDTLSQKVSEAIITLREFRSAIISAAVTGKIDVREEAA